MNYKSCYFIEQFYLVFQAGLGFCCQTKFVSNRPKWDFYCLTTIELVDNIIEHRQQLINSFRQNNLTAYKSCNDCKRLENNDWETSEKVTYINFSHYPAPCNSKCFYCNVWKNEKNTYKDCKDDTIILKFADILRELQSRDLLSKNCECQISPGEITIHPYKDKLLETFLNFRYRIFTNAFIYDKKIAEVLRRGMSEVFVSLDSGTRETFYKVKGIDCFEKVRDNLIKYSKDGIVFLKYIVFPGINDKDEDFTNFLEIVKNYGGNKFKLARDSREKDITADVYKAVARLIIKAECMGISWNIVYFNQLQQEVLREYINGHNAKNR